MSVLVFQTGQNYVRVSADVSSQTTDTTEGETPQLVFTASQDVILSVSSIHLDQEFHQIKEIIFGNDEEIYTTPLVVKHISSFFKTLFQQVISPNAP